MHQSIWLRSAALACAFAFSMTASAGESPAFAPQPEVVQYLFCTAMRSKHELPDETVVPGAIYYSGAFVLKGQNIGPASEGFFKFLKEKYSFEPDPGAAYPVTCTSVHSLAEAQQVEQMRVAQSRKAGGKVIETGWTYAAATP
jgi:hypothetical protein